MSGEKTLIREARCIVTCDATDALHWETDILIEGNRIAAIGANLEAPGAQVLDGRDKFVYPGLVNTHHHFFQSFVRNLTAIDYPSMKVLEWVDEIYSIFRYLTSDAIFYASYVALTDLLKHGCTCAFDHQYCFPRGTSREIIDRQFEAAGALGIRFHAGRGANTLPRSQGSTIPDEMLETTDEFIDDCRRVIDAYNDPSPYSMARVVVAPCQPINCYRETFVESVSLARDAGVTMHTHLGEGESPGMEERWGKRTLEWCEEIGFAGPDVWYAHGWELTEAELQRLGRAGTGLSHCPAPALLGGFEIIDVEMLDHYGVTLGLGCDGSATNDSSNLLDTLRLAYLMQANRAKERGNYPSPYRMLKMATSGGAAVLGREELGSLEVGKGADLFMVDTARLELVGALHDPMSILAKTGLTEPVWLTMVDGRVVYREGVLSGVEEAEITRKAAEVFERDVAGRHEIFREGRR